MYLHFLRILQSLDGNRKLCFQQKKFGSRHIVFDFQNQTYPLLAHTSPVTSIGEFFDFLDILNTAVTFICFLIKRNTHFVLERPNKKNTIPIQYSPLISPNPYWYSFQYLLNPTFPFFRLWSTWNSYIRWIYILNHILACI